MVMAYSEHCGWTIKSFPDTASREPGIDIVAERETDTLAIEVKGFPGRGYADPRRKDEKKRASPAQHAGQGLVRAGGHGSNADAIPHAAGPVSDRAARFPEVP
jgi:hypothetical protein